MSIGKHLSRDWDKMWRMPGSLHSKDRLLSTSASVSMLMLTRWPPFTVHPRHSSSCSFGKARAGGKEEQTPERRTHAYHRPD